MLLREAAEVLALDVFNRSGGALIDLIMVNKRIRDLLRHARCCDCGLCEAAVTARADQVQRIARSWQRSTQSTEPVESTGWRRGQGGERIRALRADGLSLRQIAREVGCSLATVQSRLV